MPIKELNFSGMLLKTSILFVFLLVSVKLSGQQDPQLSLFNLNSVYLNPAFSGWRNETSVSLHYRNQWTGYETSNDGSGNLGTQILAASLPLNKWNTGIGLVYMSDKTPSGVGQQSVRLQVGYHYSIADGVISAGFGLGMQAKSFDGRTFRVRDSNDPIASEFSGKSVSQSIPDVNVGLVYAKANWNVGFSASHLAQSKYTFNSALSSMPLSSVFALHGGADIILSNSFDLMPFAQFRYYSGNLVPEVGTRIEFKDMFWVGGSFRLNDAAIAMTGISLLGNKLNIGYALDYTVANLPAKSLLTHEIFLKFNLPSLLVGVKNIPIKTPRFKIN